MQEQSKQKLLRVHRVWSTQAQQFHQLDGAIFFSFSFFGVVGFIFPVLKARLEVVGELSGGARRAAALWRASLRVFGGGECVVGVYDDWLP